MFYLFFLVIEKVNIFLNIFKLKDRYIIIENLLDMNLVEENFFVVWLNYKYWKVVDMEWVVIYVLKERFYVDFNYYIKYFVYGIIEVLMILNYIYIIIEVVEIVINGMDLLNDINNLNGIIYGFNDIFLLFINVIYGK